jgi:alpha-amylase
MELGKGTRALIMAFLLVIAAGCRQGGKGEGAPAETPFLWENANIYFLLTDRFCNGDPDNDVNFGRTKECAVMRGFQGGDIAGVSRKIEENYFDSLGVTALWISPWFEQNHGQVDEGTGPTYSFHGYWIRDWTAMEPNFGTEEELQGFVETAHAHGIRVIMDVVINHTGPVTDRDPVWPEEWVRTGPPCAFKSYESVVTCTLVKNLPDIRTESDEPVELPPALLEKWEKEGRLEQELAELDAFFEATGYPRAPRYYIIKWLVDYVRKYGIDAYRLDTAKHIEAWIWKELYGEAQRAFAAWKEEHPEKVLDENAFFMMGEVYNYGIRSGRLFDYGDRKVDFYAEDIHSLINCGFKTDASAGFEELFSSYSEILGSTLKGKGVVNYITSHDDDSPFDRDRVKPLEAGTRLLLAPGACQVYYGDETARELVIPGAAGDATLRGPMNWDEIAQDVSRNGIPVQRVLEHYRKLGCFRRDHPAVGAGVHTLLSEEPYVFKREYHSEACSDVVLVGLGLAPGKKTLPVPDAISDGTRLHDYYSGRTAVVKDGRVELDSPEEIALLGIQ